MKLLSVFFVCVTAVGLTSCGLFRTATQIPLRALQTVTRTAGFGLEHSESEVDAVEVKFEEIGEELPR